MALTAFAASKPSVPQDFAVDLQSLSKGWGVFFCIPLKKYQPGRPTDLLVGCFFGGEVGFHPNCWGHLVGCFFVGGLFFFTEIQHTFFVEAKLDGVGSWGVGECWKRRGEWWTYLAECFTTVVLVIIQYCRWLFSMLNDLIPFLSCLGGETMIPSMMSRSCPTIVPCYVWGGTLWC